MVLLRGNVARDVWAEPPKQRAGVVMPGSLGLVISANHETAKFYTYVLWSMPCIMGWIEDGFLLKA
jgi:hypothetical protein